MKKRIKGGQLARLNGVLVDVIEVRGEWATVKAFGDPVPYDRLVSQLEKVSRW